MKILVTGATGYIGKRLIPVLINEGHSIVCAVRDKMRADKNYDLDEDISIVEVDFLKPDTLNNIPKDIDVAYYLIHSMSNASENFKQLEYLCALNFKTCIELTHVKQVIYLSGITNDPKLSTHLSSRKQVEETLASEIYALTTFKAGIVVGSGSSSFEIIRDLVEKLPIMIAPKWLHTKTQPIAVRDVLTYLKRAPGNSALFNTSYDIFGPEILTYKEMLLKFAEVRQLKRRIITVPVMTPKLSSYWLYFVTSTSYKLASALVDSMGIEVIGKPSHINELLDVHPIPYKEAVEKAFEKIKQNAIVSSWKDAFITGNLQNKAHKYINIPTYGCFTDKKVRPVVNETKVMERIWSIGGQTGWYYATYLWKLRGYLDKALGGIGLRRGRTHLNALQVGDALDFWRVIFVSKEQKKLLLYAEMKLPGEAWLEFTIKDKKLHQTATFRPRGIAGRLYWYAITPFHWFVFNGMIRKITND